jgi:hypothetical protein
MTRDKTTSLFPEIIYDNAHAALEWLTRAFGFTKGEVIAGPNGRIAHSEMHYGDVTIMPKSPMSEWGMKSPRTLETWNMGHGITSPAILKAISGASALIGRSHQNPMTPLERLMHGPDRVQRFAKTSISMNHDYRNHPLPNQRSERSSV